MLSCWQSLSWARIFIRIIWYLWLIGHVFFLSFLLIWSDSTTRDINLHFYFTRCFFYVLYTWLMYATWVLIETLVLFFWLVELLGSWKILFWFWFVYGRSNVYTSLMCTFEFKFFILILFEFLKLICVCMPLPVGYLLAQGFI